MAAPPTLNHVLLLLLLSIAVASVRCLPAPAPAPSNASGHGAEFIRTSCGSTSYPDLCIASLSGYALKVRRSPLRLALFATSVSLSSVKATKANVSAIYQTEVSRTGPGTGDAIVLRDCLKLLGHAEDQTRQAMAELRRMHAANGSADDASAMSNVRSWLSAVVTDEKACIDGLEEMGPDMSAWAASNETRGAEKYSSNALDLAKAAVQ